MKKEDFTINEKKAAMLCGMNRRRTFQSARIKFLKNKVDWINKNNQIFYTQEGVQKAMHHIGIPHKEAMMLIGQLTKEEIVSPAALPDLSERKTADLTIVRLCRNTKIVIAVLDGKEQRIRVRDSKNFIKGMKAPCRHIKEDLWELTKRCPRWRGRW